MGGTSRIAKVAELGLVGSMILAACTASAGAAQRQAGDHSFDQAERTRSVAGQVAKPDTSYDQVERTRSLFGTSLKSGAFRPRWPAGGAR
jgi:hypothetical protein